MASGVVEPTFTTAVLLSMKPWLSTLAICALVAATSCKCPDRKNISIDGSSTVFPITEAVAEEFLAARRAIDENDTRISIGVSGTGGGFKKFCNGEIDITGASRPIKPSEIEACELAGVEFIELPVAYDGIAVVVNPENDWVNTITAEELHRMWRPEAQNQTMRWNDIRDEWPDEPLRLFGAGVDSGTFDYFTKAVNGEEGASRGDFTSSEDDNVLVMGVAGDPNGIGFFGFAYYEANVSKIRALAIDDGDDANGEGGVLPTPETIADGQYQPLSRPIFIYIRAEAADRPEVQDFVRYYIHDARYLVSEVGYIQMPDAAYELVERRFEERVHGSVFEGRGSTVGVSIEDLLHDTSATPPVAPPQVAPQDTAGELDGEPSALEPGTAEPGTAAPSGEATEPDSAAPSAIAPSGNNVQDGPLEGLVPLPEEQRGNP